MSATDPGAGGDLSALVEEADAEARRRDAERNVPDYWLVGFAAALRRLAAASEAATEGGERMAGCEALIGPEHWTWPITSSWDITCGNVVREQGDDCGSTDWHVETLDHEDFAGVTRSTLAATSREQGTAEAATEGANASPAEVVALRDYHWRVGAMLARLSEQAGVRPPGNPTVDALDDVEAALSARLAATPRAEGEAAAGELHNHAETVASAAAELNMFTVSAPMRARLRDDLVVVENALRAHRCAPPAPEVVSDGDLVVEFIGSENDRWHRWAVRASEQAAAEVVRTLLPRVHAVRVHRGTCGGNEPGTGRTS